jgi:hypothetical protein
MDQAAGWAVAEPGRAEPVVPATAPRGHQRTREPQAHRLLQLAEGGQAGRAINVQGVEHHSGGEAQVGLGPASPPAAEAVGVGGGLLDAVANEGMLGWPVTAEPVGARAGQAGPTRGGVGPVHGVDGDAAGGVAEGGLQQSVHATLPSLGAAVAA